MECTVTCGQHGTLMVHDTARMVWRCAQQKCRAQLTYEQMYNLMQDDPGIKRITVRE